MMKKTIPLASIIGVLSIASLSLAQENVTYPGSTCKPLNSSAPSGITYFPNMITNTGTENIAVTCPLARAYAGSAYATVLLKGTNVSNCWVVSKAVLSGMIYSAAINPYATPVMVNAPYDAVLSVTCTLDQPNMWKPGGKIEGISILFP
jgi:hypothetical protein